MPREAARARLLTPAVKYWVCKTAPGFVYEAMECLGGNGYVEESLLPRLYREAPVNAIWEGSGNVMCLDVLRALARDRDAARDVLDALAAEAADLPGAREAADFIQRAFSAPDAEAHARAGVGRLAAAGGGSGIAQQRAAGGRGAFRPHAAERSPRRDVRNQRSRCRRSALCSSAPCR